MARKKKNTLPSGNYRVLIRYKSDDGQTHSKSFTAPTKAEAQALAYEWKSNRGNKKRLSMSVSEAVGRYLDTKENVLSPATFRSYDSMYRNHVIKSSIADLNIYDLGSDDVQLWVSSMVGDVTSKSIKNIYGVLSATLSMFVPNNNIRVQLPQVEKKFKYCPSTSDINKLIDMMKADGDQELIRAVAIGAFAGMRLGEVCALTADDLVGNKLFVNKDISYNKHSNWVLKTTPKNDSSNRIVDIPDNVVELLKGIKGNMFTSTPNSLSLRFASYVKKSGIEKFTFHDLRHYSASIEHALGMPDQYIMKRHGWKTDHIMKTVYRNVIDEEDKKQTEKINKFFNDAFCITECITNT